MTRKQEKVFVICAAITTMFVVSTAIYNIGVLHGGSLSIARFCAGETQ